MLTLGVQNTAGLSRAALLRELLSCPKTYDFATYSSVLDMLQRHSIPLEEATQVLAAADLSLSATDQEVTLVKLDSLGLFLVLEREGSWLTPFVELEGQFYLSNTYKGPLPKIHASETTAYFAL